MMGEHLKLHSPGNPFIKSKTALLYMNSLVGEGREDNLLEALMAFGCDVLRRLHTSAPSVPVKGPRGPICA
mgnify:CR=1 FL=1